MIRTCVLRLSMMLCGLAVAGISDRVWGQATAPAEVRITTPMIDKAAQRVTVPGAFWNSRLADWVEVALCGRPSDFLHETVVCATTTRSLLLQAMRDIGCRDGDAWVDSIRDFPRIRGDRFLILLEFTVDGRNEIFSLDELLTIYSLGTHWGSALGPYGFMFRGDPEHRPVPPEAGDLPDSVRILRDDPQIALVFKGIRSVSQAFADHPLAYDEWPYDELIRARNPSALASKIFDSNGTIPVTIIFQRVTEEQLLTRSAEVWHDEEFRRHILQQVETARQIDKDKAQYLAIRPEALKLLALPPAQRDPARELDLVGKSAVLVAQIEKHYTALDAAWATWCVDHARIVVEDTTLLEIHRRQAARWREHMTLMAERAAQNALAQAAALELRSLELQGPAAGQQGVPAGVLRGRMIEAQSRALLAGNKQPLDRWREEAARLAADADPTDPWTINVRLNAELMEARQTAGRLGVEYGQELQAPAAAVITRQNDYDRAGLRAALAETRLELAQVDFEITKIERLAALDGGEDPDLPPLRRRRQELTERISSLEAAAAALTRPR